MQESLAMRLRVLRAERGLSLTEAAERAGIQRQTLALLERGERHPHDPTLAKIAKGYGVPVEDLLEESVPLGDAPPPPGPSERAALSKEWRLRLLAPIAPAATALNALFGPKVDANDFTIEEYERVGTAFVRLDAAMADAMSSEYIHSEAGASEAELAAFNRVGSFHAGGPMYELRYTLQRAYEELVCREGAGVPNIDELRRRAA
jgi:transcriptional regulator with XRE-family HTH domain